MLQHNNPFRRFLLSLGALKRFNQALANLEEASSIKPNLVMFAIWVAQQELKFATNWQEAFSAFFNWQQDFSSSFTSQLTKLKHLAQRSEFDDKGPLHKLINHLNQAKNLAGQQEQGLLYFYYQERQGLEKASNRQEALIYNLQQALPTETPLNTKDLNILLSLFIEEENLAEHLDLLTANGLLLVEND